MMRRKQEVSRPTISRWEVTVEGMTEHTALYYDAYLEPDRKPKPVNNSVAVRLNYNGKPRLTYGTALIDAPDFEEVITTLKAEAEEKAAALMSVGAV
jgi:hypothetical protein